MAKDPSLLHALKEKRQRLWEQYQSTMYRGLHLEQPVYLALHENRQEDIGDPHRLGFPPGGYDQSLRGPQLSGGFEWAETVVIIRSQIQGINYAIFLIEEGFKWD